jgi:hypothetical protein
MCIRKVSGQVHVYQESEWSGTCVLGKWVVRYMCIRKVSGQVHVYQESNKINTPNTHVPDHSLSWYTCTWPLTFLIHMYLTTHFPDIHVPDHSLSWYTCTSGTCISGKWVVRYMCIRKVSGQVHAYQESEWSGTCVLGVLILSLFLRLFYLILLLDHSLSWLDTGTSISDGLKLILWKYVTWTQSEKRFPKMDS